MISCRPLLSLTIAVLAACATATSTANPGVSATDAGTLRVTNYTRDAVQVFLFSPNGDTFLRLIQPGNSESFHVSGSHPGDVVQLMLEEKAYGKDLEELRAKLGLDRPIPVQYASWLRAVGRGNFGESLWTRQPVLTELSRRFPVTLTVGTMAIAVAILIGVPIGVVAAARPDGALDFFARSYGLPNLCRVLLNLNEFTFAD